MGKVCKKSWILGIFLGIMLFAAGFAIHATTVETQAATNGFRTVSGKTYYYKNGRRVKGWLELNGKKYFLNAKTGVLLKGWQKSSKGPKRYFDKKTGVMYTGFKKVEGTYYYFNVKTGYTVSGFIKSSNGNVRYFNAKTYKMATGWMTNSKKQKWYFAKNGLMYKGLKKVGKYYYYFDGTTGAAKSGFVTASNGNTRYFRGGTYRMATGWVKSSTGARRYFASNGIMYKGIKKMSGSYYYFNTSTGVLTSGFVTVDGNTYYFNPSTYKMVTGTKTINGGTYVFNSSGVMTSSPDSNVDYSVNFASDPKPVAQTGTKTIKNYLAGALQPVGQALYIWGGGWNDSTKKGVSSKWQQWYATQSSSFDYNQYRDLSAANRAKGLDCSGFVGWAAYQVMHTVSGQGNGYTVVSGDIGNYYKNTLKWGTYLNQNYLSKTSWKMQPGDIGYDDGHTWIILGQCADKSCVVVHSTPQAGCQIAGTTTPEGSYDSQAVALATKYMSRYSGYKKYSYRPSCGNYIRRGNYMRWNNTLSDPDGYKNMTADQILLDLFGF